MCATGSCLQCYNHHRKTRQDIKTWRELLSLEHLLQSSHALLCIHTALIFCHAFSPALLHQAVFIAAQLTWWLICICMSSFFLPAAVTESVDVTHLANNLKSLLSLLSAVDYQAAHCWDKALSALVSYNCCISTMFEAYADPSQYLTWNSCRSPSIYRYLVNFVLNVKC